MIHGTPPPPPPSVPQDGSLVNGQQVDVHTEAGGFFAHLWGHKQSDQEARTRDWQHLRNVPAGDRTYDLANLQDMEDFLNDVRDGKLDGKAEGGGYAGVTIGHGKIMAGDKTYDLSKPEDMQRLLQDNADGKLDGNVSRTGGGTPPAAAAPAGTSEGTAPAGGAGDGVDPPPGDGSADELKKRGNEMAEQMMVMQRAMMEVQHQQSMNNILATSSSAISKDSADTAKGIANKI